MWPSNSFHSNNLPIIIIFIIILIYINPFGMYYCFYPKQHCIQDIQYIQFMYSLETKPAVWATGKHDTGYQFYCIKNYYYMAETMVTFC